MKPLGKTIKPLKRALVERGVYDIGKPMYAPEPMQAEPMVAGRSHSVKKRGFAKFLRNVGEFAKPVMKPILQAATNRAVREIDTYGGGAREDWQAKVKKMRDEHGCSLREALSLASKARHERNGTKPKAKVVRTAAQKAATKARRAAKKAAALFDELPQGGRRR